jgi:hypothetical protein
MSTTNAKLKRQTFSTSRELEYFSESELTTQTGYGKEEWWPRLVAKELVDNSLDGCEQAGTPPFIAVDFQGNSLTVTDNGPGLPPDVLERILDFSSRTSDKAAYVSPTRGAQGNAFKTRVGDSLRVGRRPGGGRVPPAPAHYRGFDRPCTPAAAGRPPPGANCKNWWHADSSDVGCSLLIEALSVRPNSYKNC